MQALCYYLGRHYYKKEELALKHGKTLIWRDLEMNKENSDNKQTAPDDSAITNPQANLEQESTDSPTTPAQSCAPTTSDTTQLQHNDSLEVTNIDQTIPSHLYNNNPIDTIQDHTVPHRDLIQTDKSLIGSRYIIIEQISRNKVVAEYIANDNIRGSRVRLKIAWGTKNSHEAIEAFLSRTHTLDHSHIIKTLAAFPEAPSGVVLVTNSTGNNTLESIIKKGKRKIPIQTTIEYIKSIIKTISYAHNNKIAHGDLNASQIYVTDNGIFVGGFCENLLFSKLGTKEQDIPTHLTSPATKDIYDLGRLIYFMSTNLSTEVIEVENAPRSLQNFILKCINTKAEHTWDSTSKLLKDIENIEKRFRYPSYVTTMIVIFLVIFLIIFL